MRISQESLQDEAARRIVAARPELAERLEGDTAEGLADVQAGIAAGELVDTMVVCVLAGFEPVAWMRGACAFAASLSAEEAQAWRRSFTRTAFLAGNPANLAERFTFRHVDEQGMAAWTAPAADAELEPLRRLLKVLQAPDEVPPETRETVLRVPGGDEDAEPGGRRVLYLATAGVPLSDALVSVHHVLVEAVLDGLLRPGDGVEVRHVPRLVGLAEPLEAVRVAADPDRTDLLRACAGLTEEIR